MRDACTSDYHTGCRAGEGVIGFMSSWTSAATEQTKQGDVPPPVGLHDADPIK